MADEIKSEEKKPQLNLHEGDALEINKPIETSKLASASRAANEKAASVKKD